MFEEKLKNELSNNRLFLDCVISFSRFYFSYFTIYNNLLIITNFFFFFFFKVDLIVDSNSYFARLLHESTNGLYL